MTEMTHTLADWPLSIVGGTADSATLICGRCYETVLLEDSGGWHDADHPRATLGELTEAVDEHRATCTPSEE